jgi:hypothetical protein
MNRNFSGQYAQQNSNHIQASKQLLGRPIGELEGKRARMGAITVNL